MAKNKEVHIYCDNTAAVGGMIKGIAKHPGATVLIEDTWHRFMTTDAHPWFSYVPTRLNIADAPSRGIRIPGAEWESNSSVKDCINCAQRLMGKYRSL